MKKIIYFVFTALLIFLHSIVNAQFSGGSGTSGDPYRIVTPEDLNNIRNYCGYIHTDKHFRLMNDIDLGANSSSWQPIGGVTGENIFYGSIHGSGHKITNFWMSNNTISSTSYCGFIANKEGGIIDSLGIIVNAKGIEMTCTGPNFSGILIGKLSGGTLNCCYVEGGVTVSSSINGLYVGGLVGLSVESNNNITNITNCCVTGIGVSATSSNVGYSEAPYAGGLIGANQGSAIITNCYVAPIGVISTACAGGLIGSNEDGATENTISCCYANTSIYVNDGRIAACVGGFIGIQKNTDSGNTNIINCYSSGNVYSGGQLTRVGGLIGYINGTSNNKKIIHCYSSCSVDGDPFEGGFIGYFDCDEVIFSRCYSKYGMAPISNIIVSDTCIKELTTAEMKNQSSFINWDFTNIWTTVQNNSYPLFKNADATLSNITVSKGSLSPAFNPMTSNYLVNLDYIPTSIIIDATPSNPNAIVTGTGTFSLSEGENVFLLEVFAAERNIHKTYKVTVLCEESTDMSLASLTVDDGSLQPNFSPSIHYYDVNVSETTTHITISATPVNPNITVTNTGLHYLNMGSNVFPINLVSQLGDTVNTYVVNVIRADIPLTYTLTDLSVSEGTLTPIFDPFISIYEVFVSDDIESIEISASATHNSAQYLTIIGAGTFSLNIGKNTFLIDLNYHLPFWPPELILLANTYVVQVYRGNVGITNPVENSDVLVFPNPFSSELNIRSNFIINKVELYDLTGKIIKVQQINDFNKTINLTSVNKGMYMLKAYLNNKFCITRKILKVDF